MKKTVSRASPGSVGEIMHQQPEYHPKQIVKSLGDFVKIIEVEGTPLQFSLSDSLRSLSSCDDRNSLRGF